MIKFPLSSLVRRFLAMVGRGASTPFFVGQRLG
jgi:hypothetical protein